MRHSLLRNTFGLSILEITIGSAMVGGLALVIAQTSTMSQNAMQSARLSGDFNQLVSQVQMVLNSDAACGKALAKPGSPKTFNPSTLPIDYPQSIGDLTIDGNVIAKVSNSLSAKGLVVRKLEFTKLLSTPSANLHIVNLRLIAEKSITGSTAVPQQYSRDFVVSVVVNAAHQIQQCYGEASPASNCADLGGTWNPNPPAGVKKCDIRSSSCADLGGTWSSSTLKCTFSGGGGSGLGNNAVIPAVMNLTRANSNNPPLVAANCPTGWTALPVTREHSGSIYSNYVLTCLQTTKNCQVLYRKEEVPESGNLSTQIPPACPSGWTSHWTTPEVKDWANSAMWHNVVRVCYKCAN